MRFAVSALASILAGSSVSGVVGRRRGDRDDETPSSSSSHVAAEQQAGVYKKLKNRLVAPNKLENSASAERTTKKAKKCVLDNSKSNRKNNKSSSDHLDFGALRGADGESLAAAAAGPDNGAGCPSEDQVCVDPDATVGIMELYADAAEAETASTEIRYGICIDRGSVPDSYWDLNPRDVDPGAALLDYWDVDQEEQRRRSLQAPQPEEETTGPTPTPSCGDCPDERPLIDKVDGEYFRRQVYRCLRASTGEKQGKCKYRYDDKSPIPITCWDTSQVTNMSGAFYYNHNKLDIEETNFNGELLKCWDTSNVVDMSYMFYKAYYIDPSFEGWDTSKVRSMSAMFAYATSISGKGIKDWDTGKVETMSGMFYDTYEEFNGDVSKWDVSKVESMYSMFAFAFKFKPKAYALKDWNTQNVQDMTSMFDNAKKFNEPGIAAWNVEKVEYFEYMFANATKFNVNLNQWNVKKMTNATMMFYNATSFDTCISTWAEKSKKSFDPESGGDYMVYKTACPLNNTIEISKKGPWCQDDDKCEKIKKTFCKKNKKDNRCKCKDENKKQCKQVVKKKKCSNGKNREKCPKSCNYCFNF